MIQAGQPILASDLAIPVTAGEALAVRDAVYIDPADGKAYKCDADDLSKIGFVGFVLIAAAANAATSILPEGILGGFTGLTVGSYYYLSTASGAITATQPANYKIVAKAVTSTVVKIYTDLTVRTRVYTTVAINLGDSSTRYDITNPSGTTFRYTYDLGTSPGITTGNPAIGAVVRINAQNFNAANNGFFTVTGQGVNYFEVTNASGVAENDKTIGTGSIQICSEWVKPAGLLYIDIEAVGAGGGSGGVSDREASGGGGAGGYAKRRMYAQALGEREFVIIGAGGSGGSSSPTAGIAGGSTLFGSYITCGGGSGTGTGSSGGGAGGTASGGDINIPGQVGGGGSSNGGTSGGLSSEKGGDTPLGSGGVPGGGNGTGYGAGGVGALTHNSANAGGTSGTQGIIIITEYY